jgi:hypothetical protein
MTSTQTKHAVGVFSKRNTVEQALKELRDSNFPMNKISVLTKDSALDERLSSENKSTSTLTRPEGVALGAVSGAATGGLLALAGGIAALLIPGIGLALAADSVLTVLVGTTAAAATGGLIGALEGWYIPEKQAKFYSDRLSQGDYLVTLEATESEIYHAEKILSRWDIQEWYVFAPPYSK